MPTIESAFTDTARMRFFPWPSCAAGTTKCSTDVSVAFAADGTASPTQT